MRNTTTAFDVLSNVRAQKNKKRMLFRDLAPPYGISDGSINRVIRESACLSLLKEIKGGHQIVIQEKLPRKKSCIEMDCTHKDYCPIVNLPLFWKR